MNKNIIYGDVIFPWRRLDVIAALDSLSDRSCQEKWDKETVDFWTEVWWRIEILNCDCEADFEIFEHSLESVFVSLEEAEAIYKINLVTDKIVGDVGAWKKDTLYFSHPLWDELVECAKEALEIFLKNEEEAKKTCVYPWHLGEDPDDWAKKKAEKVKELEASKNQPS